MSQYPSSDIERVARDALSPYARIASVVVDSPAYDVGFEAGCLITSVDGVPLRDMIDWRWMSGEERIVVGYIDLDGEAGEVELWRNPGEDWGFEFDGLVFDEVKQCRNACTFCFMRQLPHGMRSSLTLRDDDFRLSFLVGTFVTFTNLAPEDEARIVEQRISPLRVSLQASDPDVRARLIGKHAQHGIDALDRLLAAGIQFHAQIVLVPGENDGDVLVETLRWAYERPGILGIGIVPLGYTRHQTAFDHSFNDPAAAREVLALVTPFQNRAQAERGVPWVFAADEFYCNAYGDDLLKHLPSSGFYGDYSMFEDGIGIVRSTVDDWREAEREGIIARCAKALREAGTVAYMVVGYAQQAFLDQLVMQSGIIDCFRPLYVENAFFGGNVNVTGLLVGEDIATAIRQLVEVEAEWNNDASPSLVLNEQLSGPRRSGGAAPGSSEVATSEGGAVSSALSEPRSGEFAELLRRNEEREPQQSPGQPLPTASARKATSLFLVPCVVFNDDRITLDGMTLEDMEKAAGQTLHMVSCTPTDYFNELIAIVAG